MKWSRVTIACLGVLLSWGSHGLAQTGYQYERLAAEPSLKTPYNNDSMLMRAGYEQRHRDCLDAETHINTVLAEKPNWVGAREMRLYCEREQDQRVEELDDTSKLIALQPGNWMWWRDRAVVEGKNAAWPDAIRDVSQAIKLRPWDAELYGLRARWRESNDEDELAFADYEQMHKLLAEQAEPLSNMARVAVRAGKGKESEDRYRALVEIASPREPRNDESLQTDGMSVEELMLRAGYAANLEKRELELRFLNTVLGVQRGHVRALELVASLTRSVQVVSWLITLNQSRADYFVMRAEFMMPRPFMGDLDSAVRLEPFEAKHYARRAQWEQGQAAITDYRRAIDLEPGNPVHCYGLSRAYASQHAFLLQTLALNWALVGDPENAEWLKERAALP